LGVGKGDTVALYLLNCPQYVIAYFGALKVGAKITPISPVYTSKEVKHQIEDSEARVVVCEEILYDNVERTGLEPGSRDSDRYLRISAASEKTLWEKRFKQGIQRHGGALPGCMLKRPDSSGFKIF
jgi:acyl-CoA synthetase (AMP-forming)/AMP-acid ligase II